MKILKSTAAICSLAYCVSVGMANAQTFPIEDVGDYGGSHPSYPASNAVDGNTNFSSRWAAEQGGDATNLWVDLGSAQRIDDVGIAWGRGNQRTYDFEIRARAGTSGSWTRVYRGTSSGTTDQIEIYNVTDMDARQIRVKTFSNSAGTIWTDITEFEVHGTGGRSGGNNGVDNTPETPPTGGSEAVTVPALIQAEDFTDYSDSGSVNEGGEYRDTGVDIQATGDTGGGYNVGWMVTGEWLEYEINVPSSGAYEADVRVASANSNGTFNLAIDGSVVSNTVSVAQSGWQSYNTLTLDLGNLSAGDHTLRLNVVTSSFNVNWIDIKESDGSSPTEPTEPTEPGDFGLDPNKEPWENFDLSDWVIDTPAYDTDGLSERFGENDWDDISNDSRQYFFTHTDGGMRFVTRIDGAKTSSGTQYTRSELREMLRAGADGISTVGVNENNWVLGYQPNNLDYGAHTSGAQDNTPTRVGGRNGVLKATLRVNKVTTTGSGVHVGRTIIGQIHADNDEPARLYYHKYPGDTHGCIYLAHEIRDSDDVNFDIIGNEDCDDPSNGIELDELFSYEIINEGAEIQVIIRRGDQDGSIIGSTTVDMNELNSGYDRDDEWMYFKAGIYTQNNRGNGSDGDIATFYRLSNTHD